LVLVSHQKIENNIQKKYQQKKSQQTPWEKHLTIQTDIHQLISRTRRLKSLWKWEHIIIIPYAQL